MNETKQYLNGFQRGFDYALQLTIEYLTKHGASTNELQILQQHTLAEKQQTLNELETASRLVSKQTGVK